MKNRAVLFANLGSPDNSDLRSLRKYLDQFLMDPCVLQLPWVLRRLLVSLFILPFRPEASAQAYRRIWLEEGSPLIVLSMRLLAAIKKKTEVPVAMAMRYGSPSIESQLLALARQAGIEEILFIPLYPHFAKSTVTTSIIEAKRVIKQHGLNIKLIPVNPFYEDEAYINSLVNSAKPWLGNKSGFDHSGFDHILFSYHGLPELHITKADPTAEHCLKIENCCSTPSPAHASCYRHQVFRTTQCFVDKTGLRPDQYTVTFQSRLGSAKWLEPATKATLIDLAGKGVKRVLVICPAFVTDCLETLEEIQIQGTETFKNAGGESLTLIPCLNDHADWIDVLCDWCERGHL